VNGTALVLDASLLVLFIVGSTSRDLIGRHKRLRAFTAEDFELLLRLIAVAPRVIVTPNTLTETSNLIGQIEDPARTQIRETFRQVIGATEEEYVPSVAAASASHFLRLGLTDAGLIQLMSGSRSLLTTDLDLYLAAVQAGAEAVNFNHLRQQAGTQW
jgi:hypothetical protein